MSAFLHGQHATPQARHIFRRGGLCSGATPRLLFSPTTLRERRRIDSLLLSDSFLHDSLQNANMP